MLLYALAKTLWFALPENRTCRWPGCTRKATDLHHSRGRIGALLLDERFWKPLCRRHHDTVQLAPELARQYGLLCERGKWNVPERL